MTNTIKSISFSDTILHGKKFSLRIYIDGLGNKGGLFAVEEPGKAPDEATLDEDSMTALRYLLASKGGK